MKKSIILLAALVVVLSGCLKEEEMVGGQPGTLGVPADSVWTVTLQAVKEDVATKGLEIGGEDEAATTLLRSVWKDRDPVQVYLGKYYIGTLYASPDETDPHKATLTGTVTASVITPGTTELTLLTPRKEWDYTGQVGKLLKTDYSVSGQSNLSIEYRYHFTLAENVLVTEATIDQRTGKASLTTENATFENQQSIYRLSFCYQKDGTGDKTPIPAKRILIDAEKGGLVQTRRMDGTVTTGSIEIVQDVNDLDLLTQPFFVALRNENTTEDEALRFKVVDTDGVTFYGSKTIPAEYKANGTFVSLKNATLTGRLELQQGTTAVDSAL